ncbi:hypothetical protein AOLI_G00155810 [Acnodon oligacanthus]
MHVVTCTLPQRNVLIKFSCSTHRYAHSEAEPASALKWFFVLECCGFQGKSDDIIRSDSEEQSHLWEPAGSGVFLALLSYVSGVWTMLSDFFTCGGQVGQSVEETKPEEPQSSVRPLFC